MKKQRKHYTPEEKVAILRRHLLDKVPVSELCDELGLQPTVFYRWQKEFFENGAAAFRAESAAQPLSRAGTDRVPGEEDPDQGRGPGRADGGAHRAKKKPWGTLTGVWVPHDVRDQVVDFVRRWSEKTEIGAGRFIRVAGRHRQQVLRLAGALRQGERAQRLGSPRFLAGAVGEGGHHRLPPEESVGGLSAADVHDAGCRRGGGESGQRMASAETSGTAVASGTASRRRRAPASSSRSQPHQHWHIDVSYINISGHVLLPVQRAGWLQPLHRALGSAGVDDGSGHRDHLGASQGEVPGGAGRGSSPTTGRSSSPRTSRSSFGSRA